MLTVKENFRERTGLWISNKIKRKNRIKDFKFNSVEFYDIIQQEYYETEEDLLFLLNNTPIIPNFGKEKGYFSKFNEYVRKNINNNGIILERKLFGIKIKK